jgi:hypothetical protein
MQRTQVFANLSSPPPNGGYGGAMQQALHPGSGRGQGVTGVFRPSQTPHLGAGPGNGVGG